MAATVIIGQRVRAGQEREFEAWQLDLNRAASEYPGFLAAEVSPPTAVQPDWVVVYRFDSVATCRPGSTAPPGRTASPRVRTISTAPARSRSSAAAPAGPTRW